VKLTWTAPSTRANGKALPMGEISGYRLYYIREGSNASDDVTVSVPGGNTTTYNVTLGTAGSYTFAITAVDVNGLESPLSGEVSVPVN
jgi:fibronectin type 3 domain-containing protein